MYREKKASWDAGSKARLESHSELGLCITKETNVAHAHNSIWNALNFIRNAGKEEMAAVVLTALISLNVYPVFWGKGRRKNV